MAKRKSNRRRRASGQQRRSGRAAPSVGRVASLDDLLLPAVGFEPISASVPAHSEVTEAEKPQRVEPQKVEEPKLEAVPDVGPDGPHVRLGAVWAVITFIATAGLVALALLYAITGALAAAQAARSWRSRSRQPDPVAAAAGAALIPLAATVSLGVAVGAIVAVAVGALLYRPDPKRSAPIVTAAIAVGFGVAAASPILTRRLGLVEILVLLSLVGVYDASAYLVGTGATKWWEGPAAGVAFMFTVTLAAAAVFVPPFDGVAPWLLGVIAAATAPLGPQVADRLLGTTRTRVPAVRRIDSLLVLGPLWTAGAYVLL